MGGYQEREGEQGSGEGLTVGEGGVGCKGAEGISNLCGDAEGSAVAVEG